MEIIILVLLAISILIFLSSVKRKITTRYEEFAIISEADSKAPLDVYEIYYPKRLSVATGSDEGYFAVFDLEYQSISQLPKQIYANESAIIVLHPVLESWENNDSLYAVNLKTKLDDKKIKDLLKTNDFQTQIRNYALLESTRKKLGKRSSKDQNYLTVQLLASGFEIAGSIKQRQKLDTPVLTYTWNISTANSGIHDIAIVLNLENESGDKSTSIGTIIHKVKVVSLGFLTHRQVNIFLAISGVLTTLLAILQALRILGII